MMIVTVMVIQQAYLQYRLGVSETMVYQLITQNCVHQHSLLPLTAAHIERKKRTRL